MINKKITFGIFFVFGILLTLSFVSADVYARSSPAYTQFSSFEVTGDGAFEGFNREMCEAGQDFILQVSPLGCSPSVVRSDLLEEQNAYVFCPIVATKLNPMIDIKAIDYVSFSGQYPPEVSGIAFQPARAALGNFGGLYTKVDSPLLNNIGYAVIVLKRQPNESAMPDFVEGNLTARIRYDIENAFGVGQANFYVPELSEDDWEDKYRQYAFWDGRGYLKAEGIGDERATISVYSDRESSGLGRMDEKQRIASVNLNVGETSREFFMPGFDYCRGRMEIKLNGLENPDTRARLRVNAGVVEVGDEEKFLEERCQVKEIEKQGLIQKVVIRCEEDEKRNTFPLTIKPKIELNIGGKIDDYSVGDWLYLDDDKSVYLGYAGTKSDSNSKENLYVRFITFPKTDITLTNAEISSVAYYDRSVRGSEFDTGILGGGVELVRNIGARMTSWARKIIQGRDLDYLAIGETKTIFGKSVSISGFAEAQDAEILGSTHEEIVFRTYYEKAVDDYETIIDSFRGEEYEGKNIAERALSEEINLAWDAEQKRSVVELCQEFRESYPDSIYLPEICNNNYQLSNPESAIQDVYINGRSYKISFDGIYEPSLEEYSVKIIATTLNGEAETIYLRKNDLYGFGEGNDYIQLLELNEESARIKVGVPATGVIDRTRETLIGRGSIILRKDIVEGVGDYTFTLKEINLKKVAKVSINPKINYARTEAEFKFKVGIEKRAIQLSPEKTRERIESLNQTLAKWGSISDKMGTTVKTLKTACGVTWGWLSLKNFLSNLGGKGIARQKVMRSNGGWMEKCEDMVSRGEHGDVDSCLFAYSDEIDASVGNYTKAIEIQNKEIEETQEEFTKKTLFLESVVDTGKFMQEYVDKNYRNGLASNFEGELNSVKIGNENILVYDIIAIINENTTFLTQARNLELNSRLLNSDSESVRAIALAQVKKDLGDIWVNHEDERNENILVEELNTKTGIIGIGMETIVSRESITIHYTGGKTGSSGYGQIPAATPIHSINYKNKVYILVLEKVGLRDYRIINVYDSLGNIIGEGSLDLQASQEIKSRIALKEYDKTIYENQYKDSEVRYFETDPYKGLPAIVPFDLRNGWYVAVKSTLPIGGAIRAYDDSGKVSSFYVGNVGENGKEEFDSGIGDDVWRGFVPGVQPPDFPGLGKGEAGDLMRRAESAIASASKEYHSGVSQVTINDGKTRQTIRVGPPAINIPDIQCQDFMSPSDCNLLFNVCDPVICPSSRCDFDGNYPVRDVIQSGIIGSIALCLPNYPEVKVPICLTGVHAGVEGLLSVFESYQDCLQDSLDHGETVGVCDEIQSIYLCDFMWRQGFPLAKVAIPKIFGLILGQNVRGGGEYLGVADAWQRTGKSFDYFTQYYAANSYKAFKARSAEGMGGEICKNFVSVTHPQGGNLIDALTNPDSPPQYHGWFDEILYTTATNPPISQYKVFYHVFAGKDSRAYYEVYLRDPAETSFYQDVPYRRIVATGFIGIGEYATATEDFTAPSGYKQLCIVVNGQEECGFKLASTSFAVNYVTDSYVAQQASQIDITSETGCVSGSPSAYSFLAPNFQSGAEEFLSPEIYNRGIIRICSTDNPGLGTDAYAGGEDSRWKDVGYCGIEKVRCWLDTESVRDVIRTTSIEEDVLGEVTDSYVNKLIQEGGYISDFDGFVEEVKEIPEENHLERANLISEGYQRVFFNHEKAYLLLLRGIEYGYLALEAYGLYESKRTSEVSIENEELEESGLSEVEIDLLETATRCEDCAGRGGAFDYCYEQECSVLNNRVGNCLFYGPQIIEALPGGKAPRPTGECVTINQCEACGVGKGVCDETECTDIGNLLDVNCEYKDRIWPVSNTCKTPEGEAGEEVAGEEITSCSDCGKGLGNLCDREECEQLGECEFKNRFIIPDQCVEVEGEEEAVEEELSCGLSDSCRLVLGREIIRLAREEKTEYGLSDEQIRRDRVAESFECLVLQVAWQESAIQHCVPHQEDSDPLHCDGDENKLVKGDDGNSMGVMQINTLVHTSVDVADFETNVKYAMYLLRQGYSSSSKDYACNSESYSGWQRALRYYNGWNTDCSKGNVNYVEEVIGEKNRADTRNTKESLVALFPECG